MTEKDQIVKKLCARWNAPFPQLAISEALRAAFPDLQKLSLPIRLGRLAATRGVTDIMKRKLAYDGVISATPRGTYLIEVNHDQPATRQRFTIAHELGHTFFFDIDPGRRDRVRDGNLELVNRFDPEESLCNYAAAEILMPRCQFGAVTRKRVPGAEALVHLGKVFNVSIQAATRRVIQMIPLKLVVAQWEFMPSGKIYQSNWVAGVTTRKHVSREKLVVGPNDPAFRIFHEQDAYRGTIWVSLDGPMDGYFVDLIAWRASGVRRVLTMFVLERSPDRVLFDYRVPLNEREQMSLF